MMNCNKKGLKYIAAGFHEDVGDLLTEFVNKSTTHFPEYSEIWRRRHFSLIYMGRPDHNELDEFTNEIFRITCQYLSSPSFYQQVGAVFTLYALYLNQISTPPIKIRIEIHHFRIVKALLMEAVMKKHKTLHFVIDYLMKNAFIYVASATLRGPLTACTRKVPKDHEIVCTMNTQYKSDIMQYSVNNGLSKLKELHAAYYKEKEKLADTVNLHLNAAHNVYDKFIKDLDDLVNPQKEEEETLGSRRAKIKALSYIRETKDRFGQPNAEPNSESDVDGDVDTSPSVSASTQKKTFRRRRVPKHLRRCGRPPKQPKPESPPHQCSSDEEDLAIRHLILQQQEFYLPPPGDERKKAKSKRDAYYKVSPKREETESSDPDDNVINNQDDPADK